MSQENNFIPNQESYTTLSPFKLFVKSNFPFIEATFEALDNYGLYCKIVEYLNTVISNENKVENNVLALYNAFVSLNNYVSNYFDNLDVQEEINNKLDDMVEQGTLQEIIEAYLNSKAIFGYDSVASMKESTSLISGSYARTTGYYEKNDGGGALYLITDTEPSTYYETLESGLYAELLIEEITNVKQFGAKGNWTNDTTAIQNAINNSNGIVYIPNGNYVVNSPLSISKALHIKGDGNNISFIQATDGGKNIFNISSSNVTVEDMTLNYYSSGSVTGNGKAININNSTNSIVNTKLNNLTINNANVCVDITGRVTTSSTIIQNCSMNNYRMAGINIDDNVNDTYIDNVFMYGSNSSDVGIRLYNNVQALNCTKVSVIHSNFGMYCGTGASIDTSKTYDEIMQSLYLKAPSHCKFTNCFFDNLATIGCVLSYVRDSKFINCWFSVRGTAGVLLNTYAHDITFDSCTFQYCSLGIKCASPTVHGVTITNCGFINNGYGNTDPFGIKIENGKDFLIIGNFFSNSERGTGTYNIGMTVAIWISVDTEVIIANNIINTMLSGYIHLPDNPEKIVSANNITD